MFLISLGHGLETMMGKRQDQNPDEGFLMTKMPMYFLVTVDKVCSTQIFQ
jgi:hypothetical protein